MKIDRLLGITIYLLNHNKASGKFLANKFEVSLRTIQRDIETLCKAGIPIVSTFGTDGGYEILQTFQMSHQIAESKDYSFIITALQGLATAYQDPQIEATLEKIMSVYGASQTNSKIYLDFSVLQEDCDTNEKISILDNAILNKKIVVFEYINADDLRSIQEVEPIGVTYRWYSWYLVGYSLARNNYRLYKLIRMQSIKVLESSFNNKHCPLPVLLEKMNNKDNHKYIKITLLCKAESRAKVLEYLKGKIIEEMSSGDFIMQLIVPKNEHFWFASLLALGNNVRVLEPEDLRLRLMDKCNEIISMYKKV